MTRKFTGRIAEASARAARREDRAHLMTALGYERFEGPLMAGGVASIES
jgi:hypothetical protein